MRNKWENRLFSESRYSTGVFQRPLEKELLDLVLNCTGFCAPKVSNADTKVLRPEVWFDFKVGR